MCGRLALTLPPDMVASLFDAVFDAPENLEPRYNVCPTENILVVVALDGTRRLMRKRWGLLPRWYKTPNGGPLLINARSETIAEKPAFARSARQRRCLVPASGFYEWKKAEDGGRDPFYVRPTNGSAFAFAGIWRDWTGETGETLSTVAIVTCAANSDIAHIHHRMPVMVAPENFGLWLGEEGHGAARLMTPAQPGSAIAHAVSREVNKARTDSAQMLEPI